MARNNSTGIAKLVAKRISASTVPVSKSPARTVAQPAPITRNTGSTT